MIQYPIAAGGIRTRILESGDESAPAVVFVHGLGARADRFGENLDAVAAAGYRAIALDLPGHGFADRGALPYSVPFFSGVVGAVLDTLAVASADLVGTSLGGAVVADLAVARPELAHSLTLIGSLGVVPIGPAARNGIADAIADASGASVRAKLTHVIADPSTVTDAWVREESRFATAPGSGEAAAGLAGYFRDHVDEHVAGPALAERGGDLPTLLVWGELDRTIPLAVGHAAQAVLPHARFAVIQQAGHAPYLERATAFTEVLLDFLADAHR